MPSAAAPVLKIPQVCFDNWLPLFHLCAGDGEVDVIMLVVANPGLLGIEFQFTLQLLAVFRLKQQGLQSGIEDHPLDAPLCSWAASFKK